MVMRFSIALALVLGVLVILPVRVHAHGGGASLEATSTVYLIDVGYDPAEFVAGSPSRFEFELLKDGARVDYELVWVRIVEDKKTKLATGISHDNFGKTTLLYDFALPGIYTLEASFRDERGEVAASSFQITVRPSNDGSRSSTSLIAVTGAVTALACFVLFRFFRRRA